MAAIETLKRWVRVGARFAPDPREQRRVVVGNTIALVLLVNTVAYAPIVYLLGPHAQALLLLPLGATYLLPLWLNHLGRHSAARFSLVTLAVAILTLYSFVLGLRGEVSLLFGVACLPFIVCNRREYVVIAWGALLPLASALFVSMGGDRFMGPQLLSPAAGYNLHIALIVGTWGLLLSIVLSFELSNGRAEKELEIANADTQRLLNRAAQGFATLDGNGCLRRARSAAFDRWFDTPAPGARFADCLGRVDEKAGSAFEHVWTELASHTSATDALLDQLPKLAAASGAHYRLEYKPEIDGVREGMMVVISDVTDEVERMRGEQNQRALEQELAQAHKLESVGRLAAGVAHEINTPIQYIGDSIHFVRDGVEDLRGLLDTYQELCRAVAQESASTEDVERVTQAEDAADLPYLVEHMPKSLNRALEGVERVAAIVRSMKEFAHPDAAEKMPADLNHALETTLTIAHNTVKNVATVETALGLLPKVHCYLGSLNQVFLNLLANAADAIAESIAGTDRLGHIRIKTVDEGDTVLISISDDGVGIPDAIQERVFEQFFTTKPVGKGTGQGLAVAHRTVTMHGGSIWFESAAGRGTTFFVRLPIDAERPARRPRIHAPSLSAH